MTEIKLDTGQGPTLAQTGPTLQPSTVTLNTQEAKLAQADGAGDPIGDQDVERDSLEEMSEVLKGFKQRAQQEEGRYWQTVDSEYWVCLCFQTREQKEEFLQKLGLLMLGDKYLDGLEVAQKLGVEIESPTPPMPRLRIPADMKGIALQPEED